MPEPSSPEHRRPKVGIGAIVKNEAPYLVEWIAFHRVIGISTFLIVDNASTDGTGELLAKLAAAGIVTQVPRPPSRDEEGPQLPAYRQMLSAYADPCDWIAFVDADEFIMPLGRHRSLPDHLAKIAKDRTGCVVLNWAAYGSSGLKTRDSRPVIERFTWRANRDHQANHFFKSIVRPDAVLRVKNPHRVKLRTGFKEADPNGKRPEFTAGWSLKNVCWSGFRVNHYMIKSHEEWLAKRARGLATHPTLVQWPEEYFAVNDHSGEQDLVDPGLLAATKEEMARITALAGLLADGARTT